MVVKKKGLYLGLLVALLGIGNVMQAYRLTIKNETLKKVKFTISYYGRKRKSCSSDTRELASEKHMYIRSRLCEVKKVTAELRHARTTKSGRVLKPLEIKVERNVPRGRAGNTTWTIKGPFHDRGRVKYKIVGGLE